MQKEQQQQQGSPPPTKATTEAPTKTTPRPRASSLADARADDALPEMQLPQHLSAATERHRHRRRVLRYALNALYERAQAKTAGV
jgi:hypothetical protein